MNLETQLAYMRMALRMDVHLRAWHTRSIDQWPDLKGRWLLFGPWLGPLNEDIQHSLLKHVNHA